MEQDLALEDKVSQLEATAHLLVELPYQLEEQVLAKVVLECPEVLESASVEKEKQQEEEELLEEHPLQWEVHQQVQEVLE